MIDLDRLQTTLQVSGLQIKDPPLYQVISQLLQAVREFQMETEAGIAGTAAIISNGPLLTHTSDLASFPSSRQLLAGTAISFDDSVFGERTVNGVDREWSVLTDGNLIEPELIFAGGDVIMTHMP